MKFIKMLEEIIINKEYEVINDEVIFSVLVDSQTGNQYMFFLACDDYPKWRMTVSYAEESEEEDDFDDDNDSDTKLETFVVIGPIDYDHIIFGYDINEDNKTKSSFIQVTDLNGEYQLDKIINRKRIFTPEFKTVLLDFATDLKNERKYLEYLLDNLASLKIDVLENFVKLEDEAKRLIIEVQ